MYVYPKKEKVEKIFTPRKLYLLQENLCSCSIGKEHVLQEI